MQTVGAYEAKRHFGQLLAAVARGETVTITKHGVPVAMVDAWLETRKGITLGDDLTVRAMIDEGRP